MVRKNHDLGFALQKIFNVLDNLGNLGQRDLVADLACLGEGREIGLGEFLDRLLVSRWVMPLAQLLDLVAQLG